MYRHMIRPADIRAATVLRYLGFLVAVFMLELAGTASGHAQAIGRAVQDLFSTFDTHMGTLQPDVVKLRMGLGFIVTARLDGGTSKIYPEIGRAHV